MKHEKILSLMKFQGDLKFDILIEKSNMDQDLASDLSERIMDFFLKSNIVKKKYKDYYLSIDNKKGE